MNIRLVLVDDHEMFREALAQALTILEFDVVATAANGHEGIAAAEASHADVVVMDVVMPGASGITVVRDLKRSSSHAKVLILTAVAEPAFALDALRAGACGYALKTQGLNDLTYAIGQAARGARYLAPALAEQIDGEQLRASPADHGVLGVLSPRELEVFDLVVAGRTSETIGKDLFISVKTVETHRTRINKKLNAHSTAALVRLAARCGRLQLF